MHKPSHLVGADSLTISFNIRAPRRDEFAAWSILWDGYNAFYGRSGATALSGDIIQTTWQRLFDDDEPVHALVAESGGELVGLAHYIFHRNTIMIGPVCYLQDLFTAEAVRGMGVGRALIHAVYERAKEAGATRVYWHTHETNATAMKLYDSVADRSGFVVYRSRPS